MLKHFVGELLGTFILVFLGCGVVGYTVLINQLSLIQIAGVWGIAVFIAILVSRNFSNAHLNPAVSLGFYFNKNIGLKTFGIYLVGQLLGAFIAAFAVFMIFENQILLAEGGNFSINTAMIFGEYYPNPGNASLNELKTSTAFLFEFGGTFLLMFAILVINHNERLHYLIKAAAIGITLSILIYVIAPYTQAGFNPARDFAPRLFSYFNGYENIAFSGPSLGFITVYILGPIVGASSATLLFKLSLDNRRSKEKLSFRNSTK